MSIFAGGNEFGFLHLFIAAQICLRDKFFAYLLGTPKRDLTTDLALLMFVLLIHGSILLIIIIHKKKFQFIFF